MGIQTFPDTVAGLTSANAIPDPKYIWIDHPVIRVFTGDNIPVEEPKPRPTVTKWQFIQACVDAGIIEAQIDAAVLTLTAKRQRWYRLTNILDRDNQASSGIRTALTPVPTPSQWNAIFIAASNLDPLIV